MANIEFRDKDKVIIFDKVVELVKEELKTFRQRRVELDKLHSENPEHEGIEGRYVEFQNNGYSPFLHTLARITGVTYGGDSIIFNKDEKYHNQPLDEHFREKKKK